MAKDTLTINAPRQGIAPSPHVGFSDMRNIDIETIPGAAQLNNLMDKKSGSTVDAQIKWIRKNPASPANIYAIDSNGSVYHSSNSGDTWAELSDRDGSGQGLEVWKDYLFVCEDTTIDVYGPLSGTPAWTDDWQTIDSDTAWHPLYISKNDGVLYGGAGRYVFSIEENSGQDFAPGTSATYTFTQQALDLPEDYKIKCLGELGSYLMCGTWQGTNIYDVKIADIFPWDRVSPSFIEPIQIGEHGVHSLLSRGNTMYILAGIEGIVYKTNGSAAYPIAEIPQFITNISGGKYLEFFPGALTYYKGRPFFGVGGSAALDGIGVYSIMETTSGTILNLEHGISTGNFGASNIAQVSALLPVTRDTLLTGWRDNTTYGIDKTTATSYTTSYGAYFDSPLYRLGGNLTKRQFTQVEFFLGKELAVNEGVKISFRVNLTDSFTDIGTYDFATLGAITSHNDEVNIPDSEYLQIRVALTGTTTTPQLLSVTLK